MNTLIHADIFFFITTIVVIVLALCAIIVLVYVIIILRDFSYISRKIRQESMEIIDDVKILRGDIKREGFRVGQLVRFFTGLTKKRRASKHDQEE